MIDKEFLITQAEEFLEGSDNYLAEVIINPGNVISIEIDNDNGVNIDDCVKLSRYLESKLDRDDEDFEISVGSVGLTSPFKSVRQYIKHIGNEVEVLTKKGEKESGILKTVICISNSKKLNIQNT